jgi:conjugal transfer/entry exclusion protein
LDVEFRKNNDQYQADLQQLPNIARALKRAGVTRVGTWLGPFNAALNALDDAPAVQKTAEAMKKAFSLI